MCCHKQQRRGGKVIADIGRRARLCACTLYVHVPSADLAEMSQSKLTRQMCPTNELDMFRKAVLSYEYAIAPLTASCNSGYTTE